MFIITSGRLFALACAALTLCSCASRNQPEKQRLPPPDVRRVAADPDVRRLTAGTNEFGFHLLHYLAGKQSKRNVFFSPLSISQALLLTLNGAGGRTKTEMVRTLGLTALSENQINTANALLLPSLTDSDPHVEVSVANALWANGGVVFAPAFQDCCRRFYNAQATTLDFGSPAAADTINNWVSRNTQGKITQIVSAGDLAHAVAVLTNAVYFHGIWHSSFDKSETVNGPFHLDAHSAKPLPLMSQEGIFAYLDTPKFQAVSLPYGSGRISLYVFLPKPGESVNALASTIDNRQADKWFGSMKPTELSIILPRFKVNYDVTLNEPLAVLGMPSAFGPADFRPMGLPGAHISAVLHKAVLEVDEEGTVAAAATAVVTATAAFSGPTTVVRVDHPFFCAIRDEATGAILFEGIIQNPQ